PQQVTDLPVEDLAGEHAWLPQDLPAVLRIGVRPEISSLVDEPFPGRVDHDPERIAVALEAVAHLQRAEVRGVEIPCHRGRAGPGAPGNGVHISRHPDAATHVEPRTADPAQVPVGPRVPGPPLRVRLEPAAGEDDRVRRQVTELPVMAYPDAGDRPAVGEQSDRAVLVPDLHARAGDRKS